MFPALGSLLARSVAPAVAEQLARHGVQALQGRLRRDPSLAPSTSAEIVAAIDHYNAAPERRWTRERLFAFVAFFVSADPNGTVRWIESPARIAGYVLRGLRPGEDAGDRAAVAAALEAEMETVRELMARYLELTVQSAATAETPAESLPATGAAPAPAIAAEPPAVPLPADPAHARLNEAVARVAKPAGAALSTAANATKERIVRAQRGVRAAGDARKARALVEQSFKLLHAGGVGLAQAETYLLRKGHPQELVRAVVAERFRA